MAGFVFVPLSERMPPIGATVILWSPRTGFGRSDALTTFFRPDWYAPDGSLAFLGYTHAMEITPPVGPEGIVADGYCSECGHYNYRQLAPPDGAARLCARCGHPFVPAVDS
jgi:hypothetical protein